MARATGIRFGVTLICCGGLLSCLASNDARPVDSMAPGARVLLDAHNAYPYHGRWMDRLERALATGTPLAIEQDLTWYQPPDGPAYSVVAHEEPFEGDEPTLGEFFFERIRPLVEAALARGDRTDWPLVVLNLDFKTYEPEHLRAVRDLLADHSGWLCSVERVASSGDVQPLDLKPVLVLTGDSREEEIVFHDELTPGERMLAFGGISVDPGPQTGSEDVDLARLVRRPAADLIVGGKTNYRRWWNNPWRVVEESGQNRAGEWTAQDQVRLEELVSHAHGLGLWIRFYTLNGYAPEDSSSGWHEGYNFGSSEAVVRRWQAAIDAGVDFVATDQYEAFSKQLPMGRKR